MLKFTLKLLGRILASPAAARLYAIIAALLLAPASMAQGHNITPWQIDLQAPVTPVMEQLYDLHIYLLYITGGIVAFVMLLLIYTCIRYSEKNNPVPSKTTHNVLIEIIWTVVPVLILIAIAIPSFRTLHYMEKIQKPDLTIKVIAHQWYWEYIYPDHGEIQFDSYMIADDKIKPGQYRLLEVDNPIYIPANKNVRFLITSADVLHSFAVPAFGIKTDCVPGRINETWSNVSQFGTFYGQCSELCGVNHGFMPIQVKVVSQQDFNKWVKKNK